MNDNSDLRLIFCFQTCHAMQSRGSVGEFIRLIELAKDLDTTKTVGVR